MTCLFGVPGALAFEEWGGGGGAFVLRPFLVDTSILSVLDDDPTEDVEDVEPCKENIFTVDFHSTINNILLVKIN